MKTKILIASHLGCEQRLITITRALESVSNQTIKPNLVSISYSAKPELKINYKETEKKWKTILEGIKNNIYRKTCKQSQFQHFSNILNNTKYKNNDIIMFLDDDDLYHETRIERIEELFKAKKIDCIQNRMYIFGSMGKNKGIVSDNNCNIRKSVEFNEYFVYSAKYRIIKDFFKLYKEEINNKSASIYHYIDIIFGSYLESKCDLKIDEYLNYCRRDYIKKDYIKK